MAEIIYGMSDEEYFAHSAMSQSKLKPYITGIDKDDFSLETKTVGHALEVALFEGKEAFESKYAKSEYKTYCDSMITKEVPRFGKKMLTAEHWDRFCSIHEFFKSHDSELYYELMMPGNEQVTIFFEINGIPFKARIDKLLFYAAAQAAMVYDIKSFAKRDNITADSMGYAICKPFGYDIQAWIYIEAISQALKIPKERISFCNVFIGKWKDAPILPCVIQQPNLDAAERKVMFGIQKYIEHSTVGTKPTVAQIILEKQNAGVSESMRSRFIKVSWFDNDVPEEILI